ncbi:hypothetical protein [Brevundimonas sp.]|uniref:hypothetical protein n=1 Tax=Brevundimonas sp. TaxID=1871086 RepID=UPI002AB9594C|nr:hypothetical protein [Brevundimonas sp.]MDZ4364402.1 hypothetical protein [Brevundimonas sp.]
MSQLDIAGGAAWKRVVFTTYALSLAFFETVVMDALARAGARDISILCDLHGVRASLAETGVRGVGREYRLEPVAVSHGLAFHPKIGAFIGDDEALITLGSGNLTFGGWASNLETVEVLHPGFASRAFDDVAGLFAGLASHPRIRHAAADVCGDLSSDLSSAARGGTDRGGLRVLHSLGSGIGPQLVELADELGGCTRLSAASPFFDTNGLAVAAMARDLGVDAVHLHSSGSTVTGSAPPWPLVGELPIRAVQLDAFADSGGRQGRPRPLHAKAYELVCRRGRILVSGSANATKAGLIQGLGEGSAPPGNLEAVVVRVQPSRTPIWGWTETEAPEFVSWTSDTAEAEDAENGVLRSQLDGARLKGWVLSPSLMGRALLTQVTAAGRHDLDDIEIDADGRFELTVPELEQQAWTSSRMVLRVEGAEGAAEGYVTFAAVSAAARRFGDAAPRLFAVLGGCDTPEDLIFLLDYLYAAQSQATVGYTGGGGTEDLLEDDETPVRSQDLLWLQPEADDAHRGDGVSRSLIQQFLAVLKSRKPGFEKPDGPDGEDEGDAGAAKRAERRQNRHEEALFEVEYATDRYLEWALGPEEVDRAGVMALGVFVHMAQRLEWSRGRLIEGLAQLSGRLTPASITGDAVAFAFNVLLASVESAGAVQVRAVFMRLKLPFDGSLLDPEAFPLFAEATDLSPAEAWARVAAVRCIEEAVLEFADCLRSGDPLRLLALAKSPVGDLNASIWPDLKRALTDPRARSGIQYGVRRQEVCPRCSMALSLSEKQMFRRTMITTAGNCGHGVIIFGGAG